MRGLRESRASRDGTRIRRFARRGKITKNLWDWVVNGSHCNLCALALGLALYISYTALMSPEQGRNSCPLLRSCFIGSFHVDVSKCLSRRLLFDFTSFLSSSLVDFTLVAFIVCRPLQFLVSHINLPGGQGLKKYLVIMSTLFSQICKTISMLVYYHDSEKWRVETSPLYTDVNITLNIVCVENVFDRSENQQGM